MKRENIFMLILAVLVIIALFQTFQLTGLKSQITANTVKDVDNQNPEIVDVNDNLGELANYSDGKEK